MKNRVGLYNEEKMLMCGAQFVRAHNTAGVDADTQAALRGKSTIFEADFPVVGLTRQLCIDPHSMSENAALEGTPLTLFAALPLRGVPQFKRWTSILTVFREAQNWERRADWLPHRLEAIPDAVATAPLGG